MRVPDFLEEAAKFIGMCVVCGVGLVIVGAIAIGGWAVTAVLLKSYIPLLKEVLL